MYMVSDYMNKTKNYIFFLCIVCYGGLKTNTFHLKGINVLQMQCVFVVVSCASGCTGVYLSQWLHLNGFAPVCLR